MNTDNGWKLAKADLFWGDTAFYGHVLQVYENEEVFLETLAGFVGTGVHIGDCCIVIATRAHLEDLNRRLESKGVDTATLITDERYLPLDAEEVLARFMVNDAVDPELFMQTLSEIIKRVRKAKCMIRAFGEMVAILAADGNWSATIHLEQLWNRLLEIESFSLYCAYPKSVFGNDIASRDLVYAEHTKLISGSEVTPNEIYFRDCSAT